MNIKITTKLVIKNISAIKRNLSFGFSTSEDLNSA